MTEWPIPVLTNEVCTAWSDAFFVLARHSLCLDSVPDIAQREDWCGP